MKWLLKRRLKNLLNKASKTELIEEVVTHINQQGFPDLSSTEKLFFTDVMAAYRQEQEDGAPIDGLGDVLQAMAYRGGETIRVHNFEFQDSFWSLVTDGDLDSFYGVMVVRNKEAFKKKETRSSGSDGSLARLTKNYKLKPFKEDELAAAFREVHAILDRPLGDPAISYFGIYSSYDPKGREQAKTLEQITSITSLGRDPVAVELRGGQSDPEFLVRVSGSGNRISLVVWAPTQELLEKVIETCQKTLKLVDSEFEF